MAHPDRKDYVTQLLKDLEFNEYTDIPVVWDKNNDLWDTCNRSWLEHDKYADYHLVLQDDSILCDDFKNYLETNLNEEAVYCLYAGNRGLVRNWLIPFRKKYPQGGIYTDKKFRIYNEIALIFPIKHILPMLEYCNKNNATNDKLIQEYCKSVKLPIKYILPTPINHKIGDSIYIPNQKNNNRQSIWFNRTIKKIEIPQTNYNNIDVVYTVGGNGKNNDYKALKYSIRSLDNINYNKLWIIGDNISYLTPEIQINYPDNQINRYASVCNKIIECCNNNNISDPFIYMNDDFYFLEPQEVKKYKRKSLLRLKVGKGLDYSNCIINTTKMLRELHLPEEDYELHYPMIIHKKEFLKALDMFNWQFKKCLYRSLYGNYIQDKQYEMILSDFKAYNIYDFLDMKKTSKFISLCPHLEHKDSVWNFLALKFPKKSKYEL